ncbi:hypothetical protein BKA64DRAFT_268828 [Cadophora sp. MPI-SDFR-AT-0126]|nr:hypothetical protein BKA64DRAFT_268828 [Leotiomycetes sp. MPI-SDFR-AT-0126]
MIWKCAIPVYPHRVITVENNLDTPRRRNSHSPSITYPRHPALDLMLTCKEFKEVLYEECLAHLRTTTRGNINTEINEMTEVVNFKKVAIPSLASQRLNHDDDIFYLPHDIHHLENLEWKCPVPLALIKRIMISQNMYDDIIGDEDEPYDVILQPLTGLKQIVVFDFPKHTFPGFHEGRLRDPCRGYDIYDTTVWPWLSLEPPTSLGPFHINEYDDHYTTRFTKWVSHQLLIGGNWPDGDKVFDTEKFKKFLDVKVYYADASKLRVGPKLLVQDEEHYEFSHVDRKWYSTSTGLTAGARVDEA